MKRIIFLYFLIFSICVTAQNNKFVFISDIDFEEQKSESRLDSIINSINSNTELQFVLIGGNLTKDGSSKNINAAYSELQNLNAPFYVIPGPNDYYRSDNAGIIFKEIWGENRFSFSSNGTRFIGINTSTILGSSAGHFFPEDLQWFEDELQNIQEDKIIITLHHNINQINNKYALIKILPNDKSIFFLCGQKNTDTVTPLSGLTGYNKTKFENQKITWQYAEMIQDSTSIKINDFTNDTLITFEQNFQLSKKTGIEKSDSNSLVLYDAQSIWGRSISETMIAEPLIVENKIVTATHSGIITCFDSTGAVLWDFDAFGNIVSKPSVINNILVVGTLQGDLITLNFEDGSQLQSIGFDESITSNLLTYEYTGSKDLMTVADDAKKSAVVFGTSSGKTYCYLVETLEEIWVNKKSTALISGTPIKDRKRIFYSAWDGRIYCLDSRDGVLIWKYQLTKDKAASPANCIPVADNNSIYYTSPDGSLIKLDLRLGSKLWIKKNYNAHNSLGISLDKNKLFVKSTDGRFHIISARNGNWVREIIPRFGEDFSISKLHEKDNIITFSSQNGDVYRINNKYYYKKLLNIGPCETHSVQPFVDNSWIISNKDGKLVRFVIK